MLLIYPYYIWREKISETNDTQQMFIQFMLTKHENAVLVGDKQVEAVSCWHCLSKGISSYLQASPNQS